LSRDIRVDVKQNALAEYAPQETRIWYRQAEARCVAALEQCPSINFFCSPEHLAAWRAQRPGERGEELDVPRAFEQGWEVFGNLLNPEGSKDGESI
jgi:alkylmercury lyase-like protein